MVNQHKTKEALLEDFQLLQQEYNCLKASLVKETAELNMMKGLMESKMWNYEAVFESSPVAMLIADESTNIVMVNHAAIHFCGGSESDILQHQPGIALRCINSSKDIRGCGFAKDCKICTLRNSLEAIIAKGGTIDGAELEMELNRNGEQKKVWVNVGVEPLMRDGKKHWCIALNDITGHKNTEVQIKASQAQLKSIIDSTSDMIWSVDARNFGLLTYNQAFADFFLKVTGVHVIKGMRPKELLPTADLIKYWVGLYFKGMEGIAFETEYQMVPSNRTLNVSINPLLHDDVVVGLSVFAKDVTAQKRDEERIRFSEEKFRAAFMTIKDGFYIGTLKEGIIIEVNSGFENIFQFTPEESVGKTSSELELWAVPEDRAIMVSQLKEKGYCNNLETVGRKKNGELFHVSITSSTLNIDQVPHIVGVIRDISERKLAELEMIQAKEKIEESQIRFKAISEQAMDGITLSDLDGNFIFANKAFCKMTGYSAEEVLLMNVEDFKVSSEAHAMVFPEVKQLGSKLARDIQLQCKDKSIIYVDINGKKIEIGNTQHVMGIIRDVSECVAKEKEIFEAKEKIEESEYRLKLATASGRHGIWDWNLVENSMIWDDRMFELYGITPESFPNNVDAWTNSLHPEDKQRALDECNAALTGEREFNTSFRILHPDGTALYVKANGSVIRDENGKPRRMIGINRDITDRKKTEQALKESEKRYRNLFQKSHATMLLIDSETGAIMEANPSACSFYGWTREELLKMQFHQINTLNEAEIQMELLLARTEKRNYFIFKHRLANGSLRDVEVYSSPLVVSGKMLLYSIIHDITDRKLAEGALLESEKRIQKKLNNLLSPESDISELSLEDIIDTDAIQSMMVEFFKFTKIPVAIIDLQGKILVGAGWQDICTKFHRIHPETLAHCIECDTVLTKGIAQGSFTSYLCKNSLWDNATPMIVGGRHVGNLFTGQFFYEGEKPDDEIFRKQAARYGFDEKEYMDAVNRIPIYDRETIHHVLTFFVNLSNIITSLSHANIGLAKILEQQKQIEIELINAKEKAEESDRLKSAFLDNMSHEVRTPLNSIIGFSELLADPDFDQDQKNEFIQHIISNGNQLLTIINDIMDISKMESGEITIHKKQMNVDQFISNVKDQFSFQAESKNIELKLTLPDTDEKTFLETDTERLGQIFNNLIINALKFTAKGSIEIGYHPFDSMVEFFVRDTGIGIAEEYHKKIFERFRQVEDAKTRTYGGNGLGLAISKNLVELMGGKIWVESEEGIGSTFYFTLPYNGKDEFTKKKQPPVFSEGEEKANNLKLKILIAEDDEQSSKYLRTVLKRVCNEIISTQNGAEAVEACQINPDIDLILLDIQMPEMNGYEAIRLIRQFNSEVVVIAQTAFAMAGDREKALAAGFNDYIAKPIKKDELLGLVQKYFKKYGEERYGY